MDSDGMEDDNKAIITALARAILTFQMLIQREDDPSGLLCQVWRPQVLDEAGSVSLTTTGMPFCVAGMGDLLALFRCVSCRFSFPVNGAHPELLGAPGRVFCSRTPEMCCNVEECPPLAYLRRAEATQCSVRSFLLMPVFTRPGATQSTAVLEVVQTSGDMDFASVAALLSSALAGSRLHTCSAEEVLRRVPTAATVTSLVLPEQTGVLGRLSPKSSKEGSPPSADPGFANWPVNGTLAAAAAVGEDDQMSDGFDSEDDAEDGRAGRRRGSPPAGRPGSKLSLEDLQGQFGVGLKQAASRLGICPTTLKRACRRHGIQRWPRRALQKVGKALDEIGAGGAGDGGAGMCPVVCVCDTVFVFVFFPLQPCLTC
jgi:hypothetical protein